MKLKVDSLNRNLYEFKKLNDENYIIWVFDVKYQFLKKKLWNLISNTKNSSIYRISISIIIEIMNSIMNAMIVFQANEKYITILLIWEDKINIIYFIFVMIIIDRLQISVHQMTSSMNAWNRLHDFYTFINLQYRFTLSW